MGLLCFVFAKLAMTKPCHTELSQESEVSIKSKRKFVPLKCGFFTLNSKCVLNSVDISLTLNMTIWIFRSFYSLKMTKMNFCRDFCLATRWVATLNLYGYFAAPSMTRLISMIGLSSMANDTFFKKPFKI